MSFFGRLGDYLKPWEMIQGAWDETKQGAYAPVQDDMMEHFRQRGIPAWMIAEILRKKIGRRGETIIGGPMPRIGLRQNIGIGGLLQDNGYVSPQGLLG